MKKLSINRPDAMKKAKAALDKAKKEMPDASFADKIKAAEKHL